MSDQAGTGATDEEHAAPSVPLAPSSESSVDDQGGAPPEPEAWSRLRAKPILEWDKEDWRRWAEGPRTQPAATSAPSETLPSAGADLAPLVHARPEPPAPVVEAPELSSPGHADRPEEGPAQGRQRVGLHESPPAGDADSSPAPAEEAPVASEPPPTKAMPVPDPPTFGEQEAPPGPPAEDEARAATAGSRSPLVHANRSGPIPRAAARLGGGTQVRSALELAVLSLVVGTILAGLVAVALVVAGMALRRAVG